MVMVVFYDIRLIAQQIFILKIKKIKSIVFIVPYSNTNKNCLIGGPQAADENLIFSQDLIHSQ